MKKLFTAERGVNESNDRELGTIQLIQVPFPLDLDHLISNIQLATREFEISKEHRAVFSEEVIDNLQTEIKELQHIADELVNLRAAKKMDEVAVLIYLVGRKIQEINAIPYGLSAYENENRKTSAGMATAKKYSYVQDVANQMVASKSIHWLAKTGSKAELARNLQQKLMTSSELEKAGLTEVPTIKTCERRITKAVEIKNQSSNE